MHGYRMNMMLQRVVPIRFVALVLAFAALTLPARAEVSIQDVKSPKGITAWLVEDYAVPIVTIRFAFRGGSTQDPVGKEGLAQLMTGLFDEGAGDLDSDAFQIRLDDAGAEMRFSAGRDATYGMMRVLAEDREEGFELLRMALEQPRFDQAPLDRIRAQMVSGIIAGQNDPQTVAQTRWAEALYGDHPYARPDEGTQQSLSSITTADLAAFHKANFARANLQIAVVGAIDAETLGKDLDRLFGGLAAEPSLHPVADLDWKLGQRIEVEYPLPQTSLQLAYPGIARDDPEFFAAVLMNEVLGGSGDQARLFEEVREKRGLVYGIGSSLVNRDHGSGLVIGTETRSERAAETLALIRDVVKQMADGGPTEAELAAAKKYLIGAYALNNLDNSSSIASTLLELQMSDLGIDYIQRREGLINGVSLDAVKAVAKRLLTTEPAVLVVGPTLAEGGKG